MYVSRGSLLDEDEVAVDVADGGMGRKGSASSVASIGRFFLMLIHVWDAQRTRNVNRMPVPADEIIIRIVPSSVSLHVADMVNR